MLGIASSAFMGEFGKHVREHREAVGLTTRQLGEAVGKSGAYISQIELGRVQPPSEDTCRRLASALDADPFELLALRLVETEKLLVPGITLEQARDLIRRFRSEEE